MEREEEERYKKVRRLKWGTMLENKTKNKKGNKPLYIYIYSNITNDVDKDGEERRGKMNESIEKGVENKRLEIGPRI